VPRCGNIPVTRSGLLQVHRLLSLLPAKTPCLYLCFSSRSVCLLHPFDAQARLGLQDHSHIVIRVVVNLFFFFQNRIVSGSPEFFLCVCFVFVVRDMRIDVVADLLCRWRASCVCVFLLFLRFLSFCLFSASIGFEWQVTEGTAE